MTKPKTAANKAQESRKKNATKAQDGKTSKTKNKGGRPPVPEWIPSEQDLKAIETAFGLGLTIDYVAPLVGVSGATLERRLADTPAVHEARVRGKAVAGSNVARKAFEMAVSGKHHHMTKFWLATQMGWKQTNSLELTGKDGAPLDTDTRTRAQRIADLKRDLDFIDDLDDEDAVE